MSTGGDDILRGSLLSAIFAAGGLALVLAGIGLILADLRLFRKLKMALERPWRVEKFIYRHHRPAGAILLVGALVFLAFLGRYNGPVIESTHWHASRGFQLTWLAAWVFAAFALFIGIFVFFRPSALKTFESLANRWVELSPDVVSGKVLLRQKFIGLLLHAPRRTGILLLLAGITCLLTAAKMTAV